MGWNICTSQDIGLLSLNADPSLPKGERAKFTLCATINEGEIRVGSHTYKAAIYAEPANALFWKHDTTKTPAPRGAWGSWSFAIPAKKTVAGKHHWRALETRLQEDFDFEERLIYEGSHIGTRSAYGIEPPKGTIAAILSTTGHTYREPTAILSGGPIVIHHRGTKPPRHSRWGYDMVGDDLDLTVGAGMHTLFWLRGWTDAFCTNKGKTATPQKPREKIYSWMINATKSTGDFSGYAMHTFAAYDAPMSVEADGPLRPSTMLHNLAISDEGRPINVGAISCAAFYTFGNEPYDGPLPFEEKPYPIVKDGTFNYQVWLWWRKQKRVPHKYRCKEVDGHWDMFVRLPVSETPPCYSTQPVDRALDGNGNPLNGASYTAATYSAGRLMASGTVHIPIPDILSGRPQIARQMVRTP